MILSAQDARGLAARSNLCPEILLLHYSLLILFSIEVFCSSETENEATASRQLDSLWSSKEVLIPIYSKGKIAEAFRAFKKIYWGGG